ncbi:uncharacterized protein [Heterodontus francisci]|uniref:uncharacterized protein n=1 Tax=Heterodontus francisci TaxID=7792 RepID=UPI00355C682B
MPRTMNPVKDVPLYFLLFNSLAALVAEVNPEEMFQFSNRTNNIAVSTNGRVFVATEDFLYQFNRSLGLEVLESTGLPLDGPCIKQHGCCAKWKATANVNKILVVDEEMQRVLTCGVLRLGACEVRERHNISQYNTDMLRNVASRHPEASTVAFLVKAKTIAYLVTAITSTGKASRFIPASCKDNSSYFGNAYGTIFLRNPKGKVGDKEFLGFSEGELGDIVVKLDANHPVELQYVQGFQWKRHIYILFNANNSRPEIIRMDIQDNGVDTVRSFSQATLLCPLGGEQDLRVLSSALITLSPSETLMVAIFSQQGQSGYRPLCFYNLTNFNNYGKGRKNYFLIENVQHAQNARESQHTGGGVPFIAVATLMEEKAMEIRWITAGQPIAEGEGQLSFTKEVATEQWHLFEPDLQLQRRVRMAQSMVVKVTVALNVFATMEAETLAIMFGSTSVLLAFTSTSSLEGMGSKLRTKSRRMPPCSLTFVVECGTRFNRFYTECTSSAVPNELFYTAIHSWPPDCFTGLLFHLNNTQMSFMGKMQYTLLFVPSVDNDVIKYFRANIVFFKNAYCRIKHKRICCENICWPSAPRQYTSIVFLQFAAPQAPLADQQCSRISESIKAQGEGLALVWRTAGSRGKRTSLLLSTTYTSNSIPASENLGGMFTGLLNYFYSFIQVFKSSLSSFNASRLYEQLSNLTALESHCLGSILIAQLIVVYAITCIMISLWGKLISYFIPDPTMNVILQITIWCLTQLVMDRTMKLIHPIVLFELEDETPIRHKVAFDTLDSIHLYLTSEMAFAHYMNLSVHCTVCQSPYFCIIMRRIKVAACARYSSCTGCLSAHDPFCGWCTLEKRCSFKDECENSNEPAHWITIEEGINNCSKVTLKPLAIDQSFKNTKIFTVKVMGKLSNLIKENVTCTLRNTENKQVICTAKYTTECPCRVPNNAYAQLENQPGAR